MTRFPKRTLAAVGLLLAAATASTDAQPPRAPDPGKQHPHMQGWPKQSTATTSGNTTKVVTDSGLFPACDPPATCNPFANPPGTNFLPTVYTNAFDGSGVEMENTLPSTPSVPYNLHDGPPVVNWLSTSSQHLAPSPQDDLRFLFNAIADGAEKSADRPIETSLKIAIDILEGNPYPVRASTYAAPGMSGLLHYDAVERVKKVTPIKDASGKLVGGNVDVHQVWYDTHIESDAAFIDPTEVWDVPWTITYTVDVLTRGHDDFSPFVMYYADDPKALPAGVMMPRPGVAMDQTYYNMDDGTRSVFKVKMAKGKYYNLTYTWGWRAHPPRVQVTENANKMMGNKSLVQWESDVFGPAPRSSEAAKQAAIAKIGNFDPAKRMWQALKDSQADLQKKDYAAIQARFQYKKRPIGSAQEGWRDWRERTKLPSKLPASVKVDKDADLTLLYVNNTIYGEFTDGGKVDFPKWQTRGTTLKVTMYNLDYFDHQYQNVDFGGARGWENQFKSSVKVGGSGCWFTFGRVYWWPNIPMTTTVTIPAATPAAQLGGDDTPGVHKVEILFNYEPSRRVRFYQFDPVHHDQAIFSVH